MFYVQHVKHQTSTIPPTNIMCSSIIDKYINCVTQYESLSLAKFSSFYDIKKLTFQNITNLKLLGL
jgi:hypothetical protein